MDTMSSHLYCQSLVTWIGEGNDPFSSLLLLFVTPLPILLNISDFFVNPIQVIGFYLSVFSVNCKIIEVLCVSIYCRPLVI